MLWMVRLFTGSVVQGSMLALVCMFRFARTIKPNTLLVMYFVKQSLPSVYVQCPKFSLDYTLVYHYCFRFPLRLISFSFVCYMH